MRTRPGIRATAALLCLLTLLTLALPVSAKVALTDEHVQHVVPVYHRASDDSTVIGYLAHGTPLAVLEQCGEYYRIDCYDMTGYIHASLTAVKDGEYYVNHKLNGQRLAAFPRLPYRQYISARSSLSRVAMAQVGVPYVTGGSSPKGFDCSGFTQYVYAALGISLARTCDGQLSAGIIIPKDQLQCGDLVLFQRTTGRSAISTHVGIYLGDGKLIHAGSRGITVVELNSAYFTEHYLCARRVLLSQAAGHTPNTAAGIDVFLA